MSLLDDFTYLNRFVPKYPDDTDYNTNSPSYYEYLARKEKLIRLLAERIWGYEKILDETLEEIQERFREWDKNLEDFPEDVKILLQKWLDDGTLEHIINDTIFNLKLDTVIFEQFRDSITMQLEQKTNQETTKKIILPVSFFDGSDDLEKIQNAIDYAHENNIRDVKLEAGLYLINDGIRIRENVHLLGDGDQTVIKMTGNSTTPIRFFEKNGAVSNLKIDGDVPNRTVSGVLTRACAGIQIRNTENCVVDNVVLINFGYKLKHELGTNETHDTINNNGQGITIEISKENVLTGHVQNNVIKNCSILDPQGRLSFAIRVHSTWLNSQGFPVEKGYFNGYYNRFNIIKNNYIEGTCKNALEIVGINSYSNKVLNNKLINARGYGGYEAEYGASYNVFNGNTVVGFNPTAELVSNPRSFDCFRCAGYRNDIENVYSVGNVFKDNVILDVSTSSGKQFNGLITFLTKGTKVINHSMNNITSSNNTTTRLISVEEQIDMLIENCTVENVTIGISFSARTSENITIKNNSFKNLKYGIVSFVTDSTNKNFVIQNNNFSMCEIPIEIRNDKYHQFIGNLFYEWNYETNSAVMHANVECKYHIYRDNFFILENEGNFIAMSDNNRQSIITNNITKNCQISVGTGRGYNINNLFIDTVNDSKYSSNNSVMFMPNIPTSSGWHLGDIVYNSAPTSGGSIGWVFTNDGWKDFGTISI